MRCVSSASDFLVRRTASGSRLSSAPSIGGASSGATLAAALLLAALAVPSTAAAQGLLWKLPEDGTSVTYAGEYSQILRRTGSTEADVELSFTRELRVRSVGQLTAEVGGASVPARWIEFEQTTQSGSGAVQDTGPGGQIIAKLLVPESFIDGQFVDARGIPKSAIPIVRGYLQRDGGPIEELPPGAYQPYPTITLLRMPSTLQQDELDDFGDGGATLKATQTLESATTRTEVSMELVRDPATPFGIASWTVTTKEATKQGAEPRSEYVPRSESTESMSLKSTDNGAVSAIDRD